MIISTRGQYCVMVNPGSGVFDMEIIIWIIHINIDQLLNKPN